MVWSDNKTAGSLVKHKNYFCWMCLKSAGHSTSQRACQKEPRSMSSQMGRNCYQGKLSGKDRHRGLWPNRAILSAKDDRDDASAFTVQLNVNVNISTQLMQNDSVANLYFFFFFFYRLVSWTFLMLFKSYLNALHTALTSLYRGRHGCRINVT